jgi:hypothetical protein
MTEFQFAAVSRCADMCETELRFASIFRSLGDEALAADADRRASYHAETAFQVMNGVLL